MGICVWAVQLEEVGGGRERDLESKLEIENTEKSQIQK